MRDIVCVLLLLSACLSPAADAPLTETRSGKAAEHDVRSKRELALSLSLAGLDLAGLRLGDSDSQSLTKIAAEAAEELIKQREEDGPPLGPAGRAELYHQLGAHAVAWKTYQASPDDVLARIKDLNPGFLVWLIDEGANRRRFRQAESLARSVIQWMDTTRDALPAPARLAFMLSYANIAFSKPEYPRAKAIYGQIAGHKEFRGLSRHIEAKLRLAEIDILRGQPDEAEARLARILKRPDAYVQAEANYLLAKLHSRSHDRQEAEDALARVFAVSPYHQAATVLRAKMKLGMHVTPAAPKWTIDCGPKLVIGQSLRISIRDRHRPQTAFTPPSPLKVLCWTETGDEETVRIEPHGSSRTAYKGEISTRLGRATKGDGVLQVLGSEKVRCHFTSEFRWVCEDEQQHPASCIAASDAKLTVSCSGPASKKPARDNPGEVKDSLAPGGMLVIRVLDPDRSTTASNDAVLVKVAASSGDQLARLELKETGAFSGVFEGTLPTRPLSAAAFASDSEEGTHPLSALSTGARSPPWVARPDGKRPKTFTVVLATNIAPGSMEIVADVPGRRIRSLALEISDDGKAYRSAAIWSRYPEGHAKAPGKVAKPCAKITSVKDWKRFGVTFDRAVRARWLRLVMHDFETDAPAIRRISLKSAEGKQILPLEDRLRAMREDRRLDVIAGDTITILYKDPIGPARAWETHKKILTVRTPVGDGDATP